MATPAPTEKPFIPDFCTEEYAPVCARVEMACQKTEEKETCPTMLKTFSNKCFALKGGGEIYKQGECIATISPEKSGAKKYLKDSVKECHQDPPKCESNQALFFDKNGCGCEEKVEK